MDGTVDFWQQRAKGQAIVPVVFNAGIPYISYYCYANFVGMQANSGTYVVLFYFFLLGFLV